MAQVAITKKVAAIFAAIVTLGTVVTTTVFADIPDSSTEIITACRDTADGALRVIDAEASQTCSTGELELTWSGTQTAVARFDLDPTSEAVEYIFNSSLSRNVAAAKVVQTPDYGEAYCIGLDFTPKFMSIPNGYSLPNPSSDIADMIATNCGPGYQHFVWGGGSTPIFFSE